MKCEIPDAEERGKAHLCSMIRVILLPAYKLFETRIYEQRRSLSERQSDAIFFLSMGHRHVVQLVVSA